MIRAATPKDTLEILSIVIPLTKQYPYLKPNTESIKKLIVECVSSSANFAFISEVDGVVVGALLALTHDNLWAQKKSSTVMVWVCSSSGDGVRLLREYSQWLDSRAVIRRAGFQFDIDIAPKITRVISRLGFKRFGGCYLNIK